MRRVLALAVPLALVTGCLTFGPRPERTRYYVLEAETTSPAPSRPALPVLGVGPVRLPAYLDRPGIVTRAGPGRLEVADVDRWAAPLDELFTTALAEDLRAAVPAREVLEWPWPPGASPEWSVAVEVLRFDGEPDGAAVLEARWSLRRGGAVAKQGVTAARERGAAPEISAAVSALDRTIAALARDIAGALDVTRGGARATAPDGG